MKAAGEDTFRRTNMMETANISSKTVQARRQSSNIFKVQKIKTDNIELLTKQKYFSEMKAIYFFRHTKGKRIHLADSHYKKC